MSDTLETDDQPIIYAMNDNGYQVPCVNLEFSRKLEREREDMRAERNEWSKCAKRLAAIVAANETEFHLANDIDLALEEFNQLKNKYE